MRQFLPEIEQEGDFINQTELSFLTTIDIRTIRALRKERKLESDVVQHNDVWISVDSIRRYCARSK